MMSWWQLLLTVIVLFLAAPWVVMSWIVLTDKIIGPYVQWVVSFFGGM